MSRFSQIVSTVRALGGLDGGLLLLMHGAAPLTPVTIVEKASRTDGQTIETTLAELPSAVDGIEGAAVILYGLAPREAAKVAQHLNTKEQAK